MSAKHTFVICAYKESEYLEECILSLKNQVSKSLIIMETSTPNDYISSLAEKYEIPLYVNPNGGITQDWNFGLSKIETKYATIAHQDDVYEPEYGEKILELFEKSKKPLIAFSDYGEIRNGEKVTDTQMLNIKRLMLSPLRIKAFKGSKFVRRRILSLGDPISCPAVSFDLEQLERPIFRDGFRSCEDWEAWEKISRMKGDFLYVPEPLMYHRIHEESATTAIIQDNARVEENYMMYCKFWPKPIAKFINKFYTKSEDSNSLS
ncbi:MAG: glycosyltransferase [Agathobacter sp.]|nr:glycosyltransferase [Agathobacter sp.]